MILKKSVKSVHLCKSVIQTGYIIVKAHGGTITVESLSAGEAETENTGLPGEQTGTEFIIEIPLKS